MARTKGKSKHERQMGAVIAKLLSGIEEIPGIRHIDPFEHDRIRKMCIAAAWDCYLVGRNKGIEETSIELHAAKHRAVSS